MKSVLITGASGFIGRHCLEPLRERGFEVHALCSSGSASPCPGVIWHRCDMLDWQRMDALVEEVSPRFLLHLAWVTKPGEYWHSAENLTWVRASLELVRSFVEHGGRRAVIAGSCAEYDWRFGYCREDVTPLSPATLYGACKHSLNLMSRAYFHNAGVSCAWGRIFYVYGPNENKERLIPSVVMSLLSGQPAYCSSGNQVRDFLHVQDVAAAFVSLLESEITGDINIASGVPKAVKDIAAAVAQELGREDLLKLGAQGSAENEAPLVVASTARLKEELGFLPGYDLTSGLKQTIEWWCRKQRVPAGI